MDKKPARTTYAVPKIGGGSRTIEIECVVAGSFADKMTAGSKALALPATNAKLAPDTKTVVITEALKRVRAAGWRLVNLDCTIFAQRPKLAKYKPDIRQRLAELTGLGIDAVNVKAKTGENVGPVGREEAMSADAIVLIERLAESEE